MLFLVTMVNLAATGKDPQSWRKSRKPEVFYCG